MFIYFKPLSLRVIIALSKIEKENKVRLKSQRFKRIKSPWRSQEEKGVQPHGKRANNLKYFRRD